MHDERGVPAPAGLGRVDYVVSDVPREVVDYWLAQPEEARKALDQSLIRVMTAMAARVPSRPSTENDLETWAELELEASMRRAALPDAPEFDMGRVTSDFQQPIHDALATGSLPIDQAFVVRKVGPGDLDSHRNIDLIVIGTADYSELVGRLLDVERMLERKIFVHLYAPRDWEARPPPSVAEWLAAGPKFHVWPEVKVLW